MSYSTVPIQQKYGLVKKGGTSAVSAKAPVVRPKLSTFRDALEDDEDEDQEATDIGRVNAQLRKKNEQAVARNAVLEASTDSDIYDYDGSYDTFKAAAVTSHPLSRPAEAGEPKSRYVSSLLVTAKVREREKDRVYEKLLLKEQAKEDDLYGDQPKYITAAYKQKLLDDKKWEYENKLAEQLEESTDVRKSGMHGFYANLLTKNIAMGGNVENAVSMYTAGSARQSKVVGEDKDEPAFKTGPPALHEQKTSSESKTVEKEAKSGDYVEAEVRVLPPAPPIANASAPPAPSSVAHPEANKSEDVASARERYLARKRKLQEDSAN